MKKLVLLAAAVLTAAGTLYGADNAFIGNWALTIPDGGAGWLGVTREKGFLDAGLLWGGGSVEPVSSVFVANDTLYVTLTHEVKRKDAAGKVIRTQQWTRLIQAQLDGSEELKLVIMGGNENGEGLKTEQFGGKRIPPVPAKPDLSAVKFGEPVVLFGGKDLDGWKLTDAHAVSGWSVKDGILSNNPAEKDKHYGNLRTVKEFEDFNLTLETRVKARQNSGIYLRGIYEVQVSDTYGRSLDSHNMGGIYSRIKPTVAAEKPAGEWQTFDITLVERHVTVVLNGTKIIDNEPLLGCTGGALWSDQFRPGPIYLQGDHTGIEYRNIVLKQVVK